MLKRPAAISLLFLTGLLMGFGKDEPDPPLGAHFSISDAGELQVEFQRTVAYKRVPGKRRSQKIKKGFAVKIEPKIKWDAPLPSDEDLFLPQHVVATILADQNREAAKDFWKLAESVWIETSDNRRAACSEGMCEIDADNGFMPKKKGRRIRMSFNGHVSTLMTLKNKPSGAVEVEVVETDDGKRRGVRMHVRYERSMCSPFDHEVLIVVDHTGTKRWIYEGYVKSDHELIETPPVQELLPELDLKRL